MSTEEENKKVIRRHIEAVNKNTPEVWDEIMASDYDHKVPGYPKGREAYKQIAAPAHTVLTNFSETIEDIFAEGDRVCLRYTERGTFGVSAWGIEKGKSYEKPGITIYRMENGQMAELWWQEDLLGWAHQLGVKDIYAFFQELGFKE